MATLTGKQPKDTYKGLIKTSDNQAVSGDVNLTDGEGNPVGLTVSPTSVGIPADLKDNTGSAGASGQEIRKTSAGVVWTDRTFTFNQTVSTSTWSIIHNMNCYPSVTVVDSVSNIVHGDVQYLDANRIVINFVGAFKGKAYLN